ncbi:MAG: D-alanine--D-alanine ligase, partial [Verrucomicrobiota bacterium]
DGGPSAEREVSLRSGAAVREALQEAGYAAEELVIDGPDFVLPAGTQLAFLALHGTFGEDGQIQSILDERGVPYTGASAKVSETCFDKEATKAVLRERGIPVPAGQLIHLADELTLPFPVFVKPPCQGSSVGAGPVHRAEDLPAMLAEALKYGEKALVEQLITGRELTVGVVGGEAYPVVEIRPKQGYYDYKNKYTAGATEYFCPAPIDEPLAGQIREAALAAHTALDCGVYSRVDFLLEASGAFYVLEINTIPGMTSTSLLPKAAAATGVSFPQLCSRIAELSYTNATA